MDNLQKQIVTDLANVGVNSSEIDRVQRDWHLKAMREAKVFEYLLTTDATQARTSIPAQQRAIESACLQDKAFIIEMREQSSTQLDDENIKKWLGLQLAATLNTMESKQWIAKGPSGGFEITQAGRQEFRNRNHTEAKGRQA